MWSGGGGDLELVGRLLRLLDRQRAIAERLAERVREGLPVLQPLDADGLKLGEQAEPPVLREDLDEALSGAGAQRSVAEQLRQAELLEQVLHREPARVGGGALRRPR